jgi:hypothetical protein
MSPVSKRRTRAARPEVACCDPISIAIFENEDVAAVGYRHVCWKLAGVVEPVPFADWIAGRA